MPQAPYSLRPEPVRRSWIERHPVWKIPLGCSILILGIGIFVCVVMIVVLSSFHNSDVLREAVDKANHDPQVRTQLGEPLKAGWFISGELNANGSTGSAKLSIPVSGPRGKGVIRVVASKNRTWQFRFLQVDIDGQPGSIDLLLVQPPAERQF